MPMQTHPDRTDDAPMRRRRWLALAGAAATGAMATWSGRATAQAGFPTRAVTLVVPYTAGGASDISARMILAELGRQLGQNVIVENVAGAAGALGVQKVARAAPDGYTVLSGSLSEALLVPLINPRAGFRTDDLQPVAYYGATPAVFVARPEFPATSLDEVIDRARARPGTVSYGSPGIGTFQHVIGAAVEARAGVRMNHVPYRGGAQIMTDVIGGQLDLGITSAVTASGFVAQGRLKAIGVTSARRLETMPTAQAFGESAAMRGIELGTWGVAYVPAATPPEVVQRLNEAFNAALMLPATVQQRARLGAVLASPMTPAQVQAFVQAEIEKYTPILKTLKLE
jgi:tripartite-type tricarboxylate transporter receptor subunit TctC